MEDWQEKVEEIYSSLIEAGASHSKAQELSLDYIKKHKEITVLKNKLTLRKFISCKKLDIALKRNNPYWGDLEGEERKEFFWTLGFDTKEFNILTDVGHFVEDGVKRYGEFIFGNERVDEEWIKRCDDGSFKASLEARLFNSRNGVKEEIASMSGGNTWDLIENSYRK